jgi:predicted Zn-dependent protease
MTPADLESLCARLLALTDADDATVHADHAQILNLRHANNDLTTNGLTSRTDLHLSVSYGQRSASIGFQPAGDDSLRDAVAKVQAMAKLAPENPELMPSPDPATFAPPLTFSEATAAVGPETALGWLRPVIEAARAAGTDCAGYLERSVVTSALASRRGLRVVQRQTSVDFSLTARTPTGGGSGWASTQVTDASGLDLLPVARRAIDKALASRDPIERAPGRTTVILEPAAVRDLLALLAWALDRRDFDEGRSFLNALARKDEPILGQRLFGDRAHLRSDPLHAPAPCPTHSAGLPLTRTPWIEDGVLKHLAADRFWARNRGVFPQPGPGNLVMPGDGTPLETLIAGVNDGVLVTRLWYLRLVRPESLLYTGLTRDGTFAIRGGELAGPVKNFRFNETPANVLRHLVASGIPERVLGSESELPAHVPPLVVEDFHLSSVSDAS